MNFRSRKAVIHQEHDALVLRGANYAARSLHHFLHARVKIGVVIGLSGIEPQASLHARLDRLVHRVDLRQAQRGDKRTNQPCTGQVNALAERTAQHGEANALTV